MLYRREECLAFGDVDEDPETAGLATDVEVFSTAKSDRIVTWRGGVVLCSGTCNR